MCRDIHKQLHESQQGTVCTKQQGQLTVYWPSLNNDIDNVISHCLQCQTHLPSNTWEPIIAKPCPARLFWSVGSRLLSPQRPMLFDCCGLLHRLAQCGSHGKSAKTTDLITVFGGLFTCTAVPDALFHPNSSTSLWHNGSFSTRCHPLTTHKALVKQRPL